LTRAAIFWKPRHKQSWIGQWPISLGKALAFSELQPQKPAERTERNYMNQLTNLKCLILIPVLLSCFALAPSSHAKGGPPISCNTSEGYQALINIKTGVNNSAFGCGALFADTTGSDNTAVGSADEGFELFRRIAAGLRLRNSFINCVPSAPESLRPTSTRSGL
jgi:hypothetical protein